MANGYLSKLGKWPLTQLLQIWVPANWNISRLLITEYNNKDRCNRHYPGEPGLANISSIFFLDLLLTSASSVDRTNLFISPSTPFHRVFLGCPSYSFYHNCCTTFDPISVTAMIYTSTPSPSTHHYHQTYRFQYHRYSTQTYVFWLLLYFQRTFAICCRPSVCLLSVTLVHPTPAVVIFGNISTAFGTLAIRWHPRKILLRSSQWNPSGGGVKCKRGSKI